LANDIKLQSKNGFPIDKNLRPLKVGGETTSIEISSHRGAGCRITGDLEVVGGDIKGNIKDMVLEDVTLDSLTTNSIISTDLTIDDSGDTTLDAGATITLDTGLTDDDFSGIILKQSGTTFGSLSAHHGASVFLLAENAGASLVDYLSIRCGANGATTIETVDAAGTVGHLTLDIDGDITLEANGGQVYMHDGSNNIFTFDVADTSFTLNHDVDTDDLFKITIDAAGATTIATVDADASVANLTLDIDGSLNIDAVGVVEFDGCGVGFDLVTPTYNATDTDVDFGNGNKQFVTFGSGNITDLNLIFPKVSGNFVLMLKQDGTGSRLVTNYKVWDRVDSSAASGSATVKFAGGSNPTLTTDANHVDIISFFYDGDNEIAYGVASLDFQF
tara:strand:- start:438 stop:1601 length:1164 start_codon:yes stop_codon:yes gene_type:complete